MDRVQLICNKIKEADVVLIGAGAGLSASAGLTYSNDRFINNFGDFHNKYGITDMYSGCFYQFKTLEENWAYWSRIVYINRYNQPSLDLYEKLYHIVKDKEYFVITTNVDHCFQKTGFDVNKLFFTQGDYGLYQCATPCHQKTYSNYESIIAMINQQQDMMIPTSLIPKCPRCGKDMTINLRASEKFVQDNNWYVMANNYQAFIKKHQKSKIVYLELGVGYNTPSIIKYPFWLYTSINKKATYININQSEAKCSNDINNQSICINDDIYKVVVELGKYNA